MNTSVRTICIWGLLSFAAAMASRTDAAPSSSFTYQGQLKHQGLPVNGDGRFSFTLWDAEIDGLQIGSAVETRTTIVNGLFTAQLDFGLGVFRGEPRWLEIYVVTGQGEGRLSPRQPITPAPFALYALDAPGGGGTLTLPFAGTNTTDQTAIAVTNSGLAPAAAFATDNASNAQAAVLATTTGSGAGLFAMTGGSGPAVWGLTGEGGGIAGLFKVQGTSATQPALGAENSAMGSAGHFKTTKPENTTPALVVETFSDGPAATFTTHSNLNNANFEPTVTSDNHSFGSAGQFSLSNHLSIADALSINTIASGNALHVYTNGSGRAGLFEVDNFGVRTIPAVEVVSNGRGGAAGLFKTTNGLNTATALVAEASGNAGAIQGTANGTGAAVTGYNAFGGNAVVGLVEGATGKAGSFKILEATNGEPAVEAVTDGTGPAGFFESTQLGGQPKALHAKANGASAWAGYFEGRGYFSKSVGINVENPDAQLEIASAGIPNQDLLNVGDVMTVSPSGWVSVSGPVATDRVIYNEPRTSYYTVTFADFSASVLSTERNDAGLRLYTGADGASPYARNFSCNTGDLVAPVHLPHGAIITNFTVYFHKTNFLSGLQLHVDLVRYNLDTRFRVGLAGISSAAYGYSRVSSPVTAGSVSNSDSILYVVASAFIDRGFGECDGWNQELEVNAVILEYTVQEAD